MTCYFRHLQPIFKKAGIEVTKENRRDIDRLVHRITGVGYQNCPATWREVKNRIAEDEESFVSKLREAWKNAPRTDEKAN
jgi:hypothetical protein